MAPKYNPISDLAARFGGVWGEHPRHPVADWQIEVANGDTRNGYWQWVMAEIETLHDLKSR